MPHSDLALRQAIDKLAQPDTLASLAGIRHGIERETLRINADGKLAQTPHPKALGAALTHEAITTDFSESLLEFITPAESDPRKTMAQLEDIHKYVLENIGDEQLWPLSMPCFIQHQDEIPIAQYGRSNVGRMKTLYRTGLKNRYGSMMQAIAGVHFNFSLPDEFWQHWLADQGGATQDNISAAYFGMIRNYRRLCWLIPYLFGASPALCKSFIQDKNSTLPFESLGKGTVYLPFATSLRMSDLGYTNDAQAGLYICYNQLDKYVASLHKAINTPSEQFARFNQPKDGQRQQLNGNVLQIENELYSPIRPKQPTRPLEKPTEALQRRGVNYIEVRALDVNPFSPVGIELEQFYFLDVFLLYCLLSPSPLLDQEGFAEADRNLRSVVERGRQPGLTLAEQGRGKLMSEWAEQVFSGMRDIAALLDKQHQTQAYSQAVEQQWQKIVDPALTPSARLLAHLQNNQQDNAHFGLQLAQQYKQFWQQQGYQQQHADDFVALAEESIQRQRDIEAQDKVDFDQFLQDYFGTAAAATV